MTQIPKGLVRKPRDARDYVKGVNSPLPFVVRVADGDWNPYRPTYQPQRFGAFDSNCCWADAGANDVATQCNFLKAKGQFPKESLDWFQANGYIDPGGSFAFSYQFIPVLSGVRDNGNDQIEFWRLAKQNGLLPRADLDYGDARASAFSSQEAFANDYFNPASITPAMRAKALEFLKYASIAYEWLGREFVMPSVIDMRACLKHSPLQIGVPVCMETWNSGSVKYCGGRDADHSVLNLNIEPNGTFDFRDQYHPEDKTLSSDYYIPMVTHGVVSPVLNDPYAPPVTAVAYPSASNVWVEVWTAVYQFFRSK